MNLCSGLFGKLFGHKFEAVYNEEEGEGKWPYKEGTIESKIAATYDMISPIIESTKSRKRTYIHSVCKRCGVVCKRCGVIAGKENRENTQA